MTGKRRPTPSADSSIHHNKMQSLDDKRGQIAVNSDNGIAQGLPINLEVRQDQGLSRTRA
jgi:hypothetical protein